MDIFSPRNRKERTMVSAENDPPIVPTIGALESRSASLNIRLPPTYITPNMTLRKSNVGVMALSSWKAKGM